MNEQQIIDIIVNAIVANNNNEITADVLRPVLTDMATQINGLVGALADLDTTDKTSIVNAINEIKNESGGTGATVFSGTTNPNDSAPPSGIALGDYYNRTSGGSTIEFYIWNGNQFVLLVNLSPDGIVDNQVSSNSVDLVLFTPETNTIIYTGTNPSAQIILPLATSFQWREINIVNRFAGTINTSISYIDIDGANETQILSRSFMTLKSDGTNWLRIK